MNIEIFVVLVAVLFVNVLSVWKIVSAITNMEDLIRTIAKRFEPTTLPVVYKDYTEQNKEEAAAQKKKTLNFIDNLILSSLSSGVKKKIIAAINSKEPDYYAERINGKIIETCSSTVIARKIDSNYVEWLMRDGDINFVFQYDCVQEQEDREYKIIVLNIATYSNILDEMLSENNKWEIYLDGFDPEYEMKNPPAFSIDNNFKTEAFEVFSQLLDKYKQQIEENEAKKEKV